MKVIRRFFGYVVPIFAILIITYGYVYWGNLLGENTPAGQVIAWLSGEETASLEFLTEPRSSTAKSDAMDAAGASTDADSAEVETGAEPVIQEESAAAENASDDSTNAATLSREPEPTASHPDTNEESVAEIPSAETPPADSEDAMPTEIDAVATPRKPLNGITMHDLLMRARNAFHYRDYETAVASYQQLIARAPDHFDAYIELGDVYHYQGKDKQAAAAYFEAAAILVRLGQVNRATELMGPISRLDTDRARALLDLIDAAF